MTAWFTLQFGVSYYSIFCVPWLGWDLVEPVTYSVSQGSAILGLFYMYKNRGAGVEYTELNDFWFARRQKKWLKKYSFDLHKLEFLRRQNQKLQDEIDQMEEFRFE